MRKVFLIAALCSFFICLGAGYYYTKRLAETDAEKLSATVPSSEVMQAKKEIDANTEMIYQYFYTQDRVTKEQTEPAPVFLQGLEREQLQSVYNGWQIVYFSPEKVILRCKIEGKSSESYIIGQEDGYLAIFYEDGQKVIHLYERTDIPLSTLPDGEAEQIREGLRVTGEENLAKVLSDFMS